MELTKENLERVMQVLEDIKKEYGYRIDTGRWYWFDKGEEEILASYQGPFDSFWECVLDATEPYFSEESD